MGSYRLRESFGGNLNSSSKSSQHLARGNW